LLVLSSTLKPAQSAAAAVVNIPSEVSDEIDAAIKESNAIYKSLGGTGEKFERGDDSALEASSLPLVGKKFTISGSASMSHDANARVAAYVNLPGRSVAIVTAGHIRAEPGCTGRFRRPPSQTALSNAARRRVNAHVSRSC